MRRLFHVSALHCTSLHRPSTSSQGEVLLRCTAAPSYPVAALGDGAGAGAGPVLVLDLDHIYRPLGYICAYTSPSARCRLLLLACARSLAWPSPRRSMTCPRATRPAARSLCALLLCPTIHLVHVQPRVWTDVTRGTHAVLLQK